ncbi:Hypothetical protein PHPALM_5974 [Phytophthora palmivora]|uniref:Uncharacterized protein n=1 Tax=Phytophthora palmivora TaxID=4796 RepID=A0A2P4YG34_9STRA|nr:Hypothetical protein PHPALM_5974 [Phytophthora palmivora]
MKRDGKVVNKAQLLSKSDLKKMVLYLYENAYSAIDYEDAALLSLLWSLYVPNTKQNHSIITVKVFSGHFI